MGNLCIVYTSRGHRMEVGRGLIGARRKIRLARRLLFPVRCGTSPYLLLVVTHTPCKVTRGFVRVACQLLQPGLQDNSDIRQDANLIGCGRD